MAKGNTTVTVSVEGLDETLKLLEEVRRSAFEAGYRYLEDLNFEGEKDDPSEIDAAYKEWVESLD